MVCHFFVVVFSQNLLLALLIFSSFLSFIYICCNILSASFGVSFSSFSSSITYKINQLIAYKPFFFFNVRVYMYKNCFFALLSLYLINLEMLCLCFYLLQDIFEFSLDVTFDPLVSRNEVFHFHIINHCGWKRYFI